jgi:hypothetical protein
MKLTELKGEQGLSEQGRWRRKWKVVVTHKRELMDM